MDGSARPRGRRVPGHRYTNQYESIPGHHSPPGSSFIRTASERPPVDIYIDTASPDRIRAADRLCGVDGVTTNPSIVAGTDRTYREVVATAAEITDGPVFAQVLADDADGIVRQARGYQDWADHVVAKIPATRPGFEALGRLRASGVPAGITVVFTVEQAVLAAKNDATFVAPYVGRIDDSGDDGLGTTRRIQSVFDAQGFETEVLAASIRNTSQATALYECGVDAITMSPPVLEAHVDCPDTDESVAGFEAAWDGRAPPLSE